tara:strand:+ start:146 stop:1927 length:1782 start_codon:yes stop_codon:yes gene_type:complete
MSSKESLSNKILPNNELGIIEKIENDNYTSYELMNINELLNHFDFIISSGEIEKIKTKIDLIMKIFNKKIETEILNQKEKFVDNGGEIENFNIKTAKQKSFEKLSKKYKKLKTSYYKNLDEKKENNLKAKNEIIEELKKLIDEEKNIKKSYEKFIKLKTEWYGIGPVPRNKSDNLWKTYHHHVGRFYDFLHLNKELRELDLKNNLIEKNKLCELAEKLLIKEDILKSFKKLQELHKKWRSELGPVDSKYKDEIWERFSRATKKINDRKKYYIKNQDEIIKTNLKKKKLILEKIRKLISTEINCNKIHKINNDYETLKNLFINIGRVPKNESKKIWTEYRSLQKEFNKKRNKSYKTIKQQLNENLTKKRSYIHEIDEIIKSKKLRNQTNKVIDLQIKWKEIGPIPRKYRNTCWKDFKEKCNLYFLLLDKQKKDEKLSQEKNYLKKKYLLKKISQQKKQTKENFEINKIDNLYNEWYSIGNIPENKSKIENDFNKLIKKLCQDSGMKNDEINKKYFNYSVEKIKSDNIKIKKEIGITITNINQIKNKINQLENNLSFFKNPNDNNAIIRKVKNDIDKFKIELGELNEYKKILQTL